MKPCPFCGCGRLDEFSWHRGVADGMVEVRMVRCVMCNAEAPASIWDARASPSVRVEIIETPKEQHPWRR